MRLILPSSVAAVKHAYKGGAIGAIIGKVSASHNVNSSKCLRLTSRIINDSWSCEICVQTPANCHSWISMATLAATVCRKRLCGSHAQRSVLKMQKVAELHHIHQH